MPDATTDTTPQPQPAPDEDYLNQAVQLAARLVPQQAYAPPPPVDRSTASLLGAALGGGTAGSGMTPADEEAAGKRALLNFGLNMLSASGYSHTPRTFGQVFAQGAGGAEQSLAGSEAVSMSRLAAQQAYAQQQQQTQLERIKAAIPLLQLERTTKALGGLTPPGAAPGTSIGTAAGPGSAPPAAPPGAYGTGGPAADVTVPDAYLPFYQEASQRTGIPVDVLIAQARQESTFNPGAVGKAGEIGLHQIMPSTATNPGFGLAPVDPKQLTDPRTNINFAADYLKAHLPPGALPTDPAAIRVALQGYNGGGDPNYVAHVTRYLPPPAPQQPASGAQPAAPYKVASTAPAAPPASGGPPAAPPAETAPTLAAASARSAATGKPVLTTDPGQPPGTTAMPDGSVKLVPPPATAPGAPAAPAPTAPAVTVPPPDPNTFAYHPSPIPDEFKSLISGTLSPQQIANVEAAKAGAMQSWKLAQATGNTDAIAKAQDAYNKVLGDENTMLAGQTDKARSFLQDFYSKDFEQQQKLFEVNQKAQLDRATKADELQQTADISTGEADVKARGADAAEARKVMMLLTQIGPQLENLPNGVVGTLVDKYPELVPLLQASGIVDPKQATNIQLLQSARAYLSLLQKPPASGALRTQEMSNLASYTPATLNTPQARQEMLARLLATNQRIIEEHNFATNYFGRIDPKTGKPLYNTRNLDAEIDKPLKLDTNGNRTADSGLGPVIPEPPRLTEPDAAHQAYNKYVAQLRNGFPYWTYRQRTDPTTKLPVTDIKGNKVFDRVMRIKGVNDIGSGG